jgi:hypothetical protein
LFPRAKKVLSKEQIEELGDRLEAAKKDQKKSAAAR